MGWGAAIGGILGAAGQVAGGALGSASGGQGKTAYYNPYLDPTLQASQFDALNQIGFGNINNIPSPFQQLVNRIQSIPMDNKTRRRALSALDLVRSDPSLLSDPYGKNFTPEQLAAAQRGEVPPGRTVTNKNAHELYNFPVDSIPVENIGRLRTALQGTGISIGDIQEVFRQDAEQRAQIDRLKAAGLGKLNEQTILNRAGAAQSAASLLGDAGRFATGGEASDFQTGLLNRINQNIKDQEQATLLQAQYGGYNPGEALRGIQNMKQDSTMTALGQAIAAANALTSGLSGAGSQAAQAANQNSNAMLGSLGLASQQAMAANALSQNGAINSGTSMANGIAGGSNALSQSAILASILGSSNKAPAYNPNNAPGSSYNQNATSTAMWGGWNPNVNFGNS